MTTHHLAKFVKSIGFGSLDEGLRYLTAVLALLCSAIVYVVILRTDMGFGLIKDITGRYFGTSEALDIPNLRFFVMSTTSAILFVFFRMSGIGRYVVPTKPARLGMLAVILPYVVFTGFCLVYLLGLIVFLELNLLGFQALSVDDPVSTKVAMIATVGAGAGLAIAFLMKAIKGNPRRFEIVSTILCLIGVMLLGTYLSIRNTPHSNYDDQILRYVSGCMFLGIGVIAWHFETLVAGPQNERWLAIPFAVVFGVCLGLGFIIWGTLALKGFPSSLASQGLYVKAIGFTAAPLIVLVLLRRWSGLHGWPGYVRSTAITEGKRAGFPVLSWSQESGSLQSVAQSDLRIASWIWLTVALAGTAIGWKLDGIEGAVIGGLIGVWLGSGAVRGSGRMDFKGNFQPYQKTESDRRAEIMPLTQREDCEAFVDLRDGELWFCMARGDRRKGPLPIVEAVPWNSFSNFEEGSHKQWFRSRVSSSEIADWGVIIAQSTMPRIVLVAESVHDYAWLVELLTKLQQMFAGPAREQWYQALDMARQSATAGSGSTPASVHDANDAPVMPF